MNPLFWNIPSCVSRNVISSMLNEIKHRTARGEISLIGKLHLAFYLQRYGWNNRVCELRYIYERLAPSSSSLPSPTILLLGKLSLYLRYRGGNLLANLKVTRVKWRGVGWKFCRRGIIRKLADAYLAEPLNYS